MSTSTSSQPPTGQNPPRRSLPSAEGNPVQPKQALLKVLHTAGAKGDTFTLKQVMHYLGQYIMVKQLYDKQHQHIVNCGDDELGVLLGITSFSVKDPRLVPLAPLPKCASLAFLQVTSSHVCHITNPL
ncbi:hypothetical protein FKM82_023616 [Ascaphus truei]